MIIGIAAFLLGLILAFAPGLLNWFGRLPGDIRIEKENWFIFFPITSMIVISILLMLVFKLFFRR